MNKNELTWTDIQNIVELYNIISNQYDEEEFEWRMDEDNTGIPFPRTMKDVYQDVLLAFRRQQELLKSDLDNQ